MKEIVIMESLGIRAEELTARKKPFEARGCVFREYPRTADTAAMLRQCRTADAIILANMPLPGEVISACEKLKFIDVAFTGVDHVDLDAARAKGIAVSNASGYSNEAVAELTLGMVLSLARHISEAEARCRAGRDKAGLAAWEVQGKTVGIVGYGRIGRRTGELFQALGAKILAHSRTYHADAPHYVEQVSLDALLQRSDVVVLHCPLNASTRGMICAQTLSEMKSSAILVNVARGPVVVAADLADALNRGVIAGAAVDVFDQEPPLCADEPLLHCKNCLVTPHMAFATRESMSLRAEIVFDNLDAWLRGEQKNAVL